MRQPVLALLVVVVALLTISGRCRGATGCPCDCNQDCAVTVDEIVTGVGIGLGEAALGACPAADANYDQTVTIEELVGCVNAALGGCPPGSCEPETHCYNGMVDAGEECDDGGLCVGGSNAGSRCVGQADCLGPGICQGGAREGTSCDLDVDCRGGSCVRCKTFGGDGCAANCTSETTIDVVLQPGLVSGLDVQPGGSGVVIHIDPLTIPVALSGHFSLTIGKPGGDGIIPFVVRADGVHLPKGLVPTLVDICMRMPALQTCGGALFEADGRAAASCTPGFAAETCSASQPCTAAFGPGNAAEGFIACSAFGLDGVDTAAVVHADGSVDRSATGLGPPGSARVAASIAIGRVSSNDPEACTDRDPESQRGTPFAVPFTTGSANIAVAGSAETFQTTGAPLDCAALRSNPPMTGAFGWAGTAAGSGLLGVGDGVLTLQLFGRN